MSGRSFTRPPVVSRLNGVMILRRLLIGLAFICSWSIGVAWADSLESALMPGQVIQGHAKWEDDCAKCHKRFDKAAQTRLCLDCHKETRQDVERKDRFHGRLKEGRDCKDCHTEHKGRTENIAPINESTFDHRRTNFALNGAHADPKKTECKACHKPKAKFREAPSDCLSCHQKNDYHKGNFGEKCVDCHTENNWKEIIFNHDRDTKYPLLGKHKTTKCESCHKVPVAKEKTPTLCYSCHKKDDKHEGALGTKCEQCHAEQSWKDTKSLFDHDKTRFPLLGKHVEVACKDCHPDQRYRPTPLDCYACHKKDDVHKGALGKQCETCHTEKKWKDGERFDHDKTKFPMRGGHMIVRCKDCHADQRYRPTPLDCYSCHKKDDKHNGQFSEKCELCHTDRYWKDLTFDHDRHTKYPLRDRHRNLKCETCHKKHLYKEKTPTACVACHRRDDVHNGVFSEKCEPCHNEKNWKASTFDHDRDTKYLLLGQHADAKCEACHIVPTSQAKTPTTCVACHKKEDSHKGQYGEKCESCHIAKSWKHIIFDHDRDTKYPLRDKHKAVSCKSCHKGHLYKEKVATHCYGCHKKDDRHKGQFGERCEECHTEKSWKAVLFDHDRRTKYPLRGRHIVTVCESCHTGHLYKDKLKTDCFSCHEKDDKHKGQEGRKCDACHSEERWRVDAFDHDMSKFPLRGAHDIAPCRDCHKALTFKDAPSACVACHEKKDVHKRRLGTECQMCHNARDWKLWEFDHNTRTSFVLDGAHEPLDCYACHSKPMGKEVIVSGGCAGCHKKDDKHEGGFGPQCDRCHQTAEWKTIKPGAGAIRRK